MTLRPEPSRFLSVMTWTHLVIGYAALSVLPITFLVFLLEMSPIIKCSGESCFWPWLLYLGVIPGLILAAFFLTTGYLLKRKHPFAPWMASVTPAVLVLLQVVQLPRMPSIMLPWDPFMLNSILPSPVTIPSWGVGFLFWALRLLIPASIGVWVLWALWSAPVRGLFDAQGVKK